MKSSTLPPTSPLRREGLYSLMKLAPMQCGSIIGARSRLTSPCEGKDYKHSGDKLQSSIGMKSSTLPLTSPCSGTKRKTTVPLFFASTGGLRLLSFIPILLLSLHLLIFAVLPFAGFTYLHNVSHQMNPILVYRFNFALQYAQ